MGRDVETLHNAVHVHSPWSSLGSGASRDRWSRRIVPLTLSIYAAMPASQGAKTGAV